MSKANTKIVSPIEWSIAEAWNSVAYTPDRNLVKRDYIYASELSQPFYDRYLKMNAVRATNPPNIRSRRKFLCGNLWHFILKQILVTIGVYKQDEITLNDTPFKGMLSIHGRCDILAGGYINKEEAIHNLYAIPLPEDLIRIGLSLIEVWGGKNLTKKIIEIKSVSSYVIEKTAKLRAPLPTHCLQGHHYQRTGKVPAYVLYISKSDAIIGEYHIPEKATEKLYKKDVEQMSYYFLKGITPPKEPLASFNEITGKFEKNIMVEYSNYLQHYGFKYPEEFREATKFTLRWNRALSRYAEAEGGGTTPGGKKIKITANNKAVRDEIRKALYNFDYCLECAIKAGVIEDEIES